MLLIPSVGSLIILGSFYYYLNQTKDDVLFANIAGRQRMISEQLANYVHMIVDLGQEEDRDALLDLVVTFDQSLSLIDTGGKIPDGALLHSSPELGDEIEAVKQLWMNIQPELMVVINEPSSSPRVIKANEFIKENIHQLTDLSNQIVTGFASLSYHRKLSILWILILIFSLNFALLLIGIIITRSYLTERRKIEKVLRESEKKLQYVMSNTPAILYSCHKPGDRWVPSFCSPNISNLLGYEAADLIGNRQWWLDNIHPEERNRVYRDFYTALESDKNKFMHEYRIRKTDGEYLYVHDEFIIVRDDEGNPVETVGSWLDISQRKKAELVLRESEERYRSLLNIAPIGIAIHQEGKFVLVNRYAVKMLGYEKAEELIGTPAMDIVLPEYRELAAQRILEIMRTKIPAPPVEEKVFKKDGSVLDVLITGIPITFKGKTAFEVAVVDISGLKKTENALHESELKFRTLFEDSRDAIFLTDADGTFTDFNRAAEELLGYRKDELLQLSAMNFFSREENRRKFMRLIETKGFVKDFELKLKKKDGTKIDCLETVTVRKSPDGTILGYQGIIRDITEHKQNQRKLKKALEEARHGEKVKTLFLANMSHEIRTPLNAILGFTDLIEASVRHLVGDEEKEFIDTVKQSGQRLMRTVHEILDISQIEAGTYYLNLEELDLHRLVRDIIFECKPMAEEKSLKLDYIPHIKEAAVQIDKYGVSQAIVNLLDNAIKYTDEGSVTVTLSEGSGKYILTIKDTGIGISEEYMDSLFETFSQESEGYTKKFQGIGLGMAITKRHLDLNQVAISVESAKGTGTTFILTFEPIENIPVTGSPEEKDKKQAPARSDNGKKRILLVEDDPNSQKLMEYYLKEIYDISFAESVKEAKLQLDEHSIDLILLDLSLVGDEDGLDLARYLRKTERWKGIPIIALTAHAFTTDRNKCIDAGCNDYLTKPVKKEVLLSKIGDYI